MVLFVIGGYRRARPAELVASEGSEKRLEAACAACHGGRLRALVGIGLSVVQWLGAAVRSPLPATLKSGAQQPPSMMRVARASTSRASIW